MPILRKAGILLRMKRCTKCLEEKEETEFQKHSPGKLHPWCRVCKNARSLAHHYANREKVNKARKENHAANREERLQGMREYYEANKARALYRNRRWREANRLKAQAQWNRRRDRERNAAGECTQEQWLARWEYFGGKCWMCGEAATEMDHVLPLSVHGLGHPSNLRPACRKCNAAKRAKPPRKRGIAAAPASTGA